MRYLLAAYLCLPIVTAAGPWLDTRDAWLRADIELLARAGVIRVPINTWPLMWSGIINDLEAAEGIPPYLQNSYNRVLIESKRVTQFYEPLNTLRLSAASESQLFRSFGDSDRESGELVLRRSILSDYFAWNLEFVRVIDPSDNDETRYDHSYFSAVLGNWVATIGRVERWWGPGWQSNLALTNNARPTLSLSLQRNYSEPFDFPVLEKFGPWTANFFISELDDDRAVSDAKLLGMSLGFRPHDAVEVNFRRTAQWGGQGRPETLDSFLDLLAGLSDNCNDAACRAEEPGNQLAGIDMQWNLPGIDGALYAQALGEDEAGGLPSRKATQLGYQHYFTLPVVEGVAFVEIDDTSVSSSGPRHNVLYNHSIYKTGYRYRARSLGSTWDNDSKVTTLGVVGSFVNGDKLEIRYSRGEINKDSLASGEPSLHSLTRRGSRLRMASTKWQHSVSWGVLEVQGHYFDEFVDSSGRQKDRFRISAAVTLLLD